MKSLTFQDEIRLKLVHEIHTSERASFRACRRRWSWIHQDGYYPRMTPKPLEFGIAFHKACEVYYNPDTWQWDQQVRVAMALSKFLAVCEKQKRRFLDYNDIGYLEYDAEADYKERIELGIGMLKHFFTKIAPIEDAKYKPLKVEIPFMVPIIGPGNVPLRCRCEQCWIQYQKVVSVDGTVPISRSEWLGALVVYAGRIDALVEDHEGGLWIVDWKTTRTIAQDTFFLFINDQIASYVWALTMIGLPVRGFIYVEIKKGFPQPPAQNKQRRLGCLFSVSKSQDTDYDTYLATVKEQDSEAFEAGCYDEFLSWLKEEGITYTARHQIHKSETAIRQTGYNIWLEAQDIIDPQLRIYPSPGRFGCTTCAFREPCLEKTEGGDYRYMLDTLFEKGEQYWRRPEPSTETKAGE